MIQLFLRKFNWRFQTIRVQFFQFPVYFSLKIYLTCHSQSSFNPLLRLSNNYFKIIHLILKSSLKVDLKSCKIYTFHTDHSLFYWKPFLICDKFYNGTKNNKQSETRISRKSLNFNNNSIRILNACLATNFDLSVNQILKILKSNFKTL